MVKEENNELFVVMIKDPAGVRRHILETLKEIVEVLQRFEKFKQTRHEKIEKVNRLRALLRQTNKMFGQLKGILPQTNLRATIEKEMPAHKVHDKKKKKAKEEEKAPQKKEMTEVEKLETELSLIESKLKELT